MKHTDGNDSLHKRSTNYHQLCLKGTQTKFRTAIVDPSHLKHIGKDKEVGKDPPLLPHCKQPNDPGEAHQRDQDDGGLQQLSACESI